ncbi:MAG TPA: Asp-tRNA(Asn)/Glu-tRNA(Gln) amidotransferase subunit GatC [Desulfobacteraceae bacterium]|nr:Asp-tRNA(Asn)/Glu-tRNA(Gln) amidotransferase subunit GatC [Desulfobacteraceae bacterium]
MKITREEVEHVANLARLELHPEEIGKITAQLDTILRYAAKLDELETENVPPTAHVSGQGNVFREDEVKPSLAREKALANSSSQNGEAFVVPRIIS